MTPILPLAPKRLVELSALLATHPPTTLDIWDILITGEHGLRQQVSHPVLEDYLDWVDAAQYDLDPQQCLDALILAIYNVACALERLEDGRPATLTPGEVAVAIDGILGLACGLSRLGVFLPEDLHDIAEMLHCHILLYTSGPAYPLLKGLSTARLTAYGDHPDFPNVFTWPDDL